MAMNELLRLAAALIAGAVLGAMFFGGLWWTVRQGIRSGRAALWFSASLLLRMGAALAGIYFVAGANWQRLLLCLLGFVLARLVATHLVRSPAAGLRPQAREGSHAP
jgi:F1F0 ATPase subunit 2